MADPGFRRHQLERRYEGPAGPINELVDELAGEHGDATIPYVDPDYGGTESQVLLLFSDPGPMTQERNRGSGFLSAQNDDPAAARTFRLLIDSGLELDRVLSWNAYPWYVHHQGGPRPSEIDAGLDPLRRLIDRLPGLRVVIAMGGNAKESWSRFARRWPHIASRYESLSTFQTSNRGITNGSRQKATDGERDVRDTFMKAVSIIQ